MHMLDIHSVQNNQYITTMTSTWMNTVGFCFSFFLPSLYIISLCSPRTFSGRKNTSVLFSSISKERWALLVGALLKKSASFWRSASPICQSVHSTSTNIFSFMQWALYEIWLKPCWALGIHRKETNKSSLYLPVTNTSFIHDGLIEGSNSVQIHQYLNNIMDINNGF